MNIVRWLIKISLISMIVISPLIYLTYLSGEIMEVYISEKSNNSAFTTLEENNAVVELLDANVNFACSYTFIIGAVLVAAEIIILIKQLYSLCYFIFNISAVLRKKRNRQMNKVFNHIFGEIELIGDV